MIELRRVGDTAWLLELDDTAAVHTVAAAARERWGGQLTDVVPGHATVLLVWSGAVPAADLVRSGLEAVIRGRPTAHPADRVADSVTIPVHYDGADLDSAAQQLQIAIDDVVALHTATRFTAAFIGFAPGFAYLIERPGSSAAAALLALPRLTTPRTEVPAGSVAVAGGYCGVYPRNSPGGWHLLGRTEVTLFDPEAERPALLAPGTQVRFTAA